MLLEWKRVGCFTYAGYILGFPDDTPETIVRDIGIIQRELPLDLLEFFCLTPLPGSEDHKRLYAPGRADGSRHEQIRPRARHHRAPEDERRRTGSAPTGCAWETYYTPEHMETVMRRAVATGISPGKMMFLLIWFYGCKTIERIHPLEGGYLRRKVRTERRPGLPLRKPAAVLSALRRRSWWPSTCASPRVVWRMARRAAGAEARSEWRGTTWTRR